MFLIKTLYQFVKESFVAPSTSVIKSSSIFQKNSVYPKTFLSTDLSTIDFYIFTKSITSYNKKLMQKSLYTQQKKLSSLTRDGNLLYPQLTKLLLISINMNYPRKNMIYLKQVYTFQSNQINFENPKSSLLLKRFIVHFLTTLNPKKPKVR